MERCVPIAEDTLEEQYNGAIVQAKVSILGQHRLM